MRISISLAIVGRDADTEAFRRPAMRTTPATTSAQTRAVGRRTTYTTCRVVPTPTRKRKATAIAAGEMEAQESCVVERAEASRSA